jgi:hypothetical protein
MHRAFAILVIAERFERQRKQSGLPRSLFR